MAIYNDEKLLQLNGWTIECELPFEIRHEDGSFATRQAADIVLESIIDSSNLMKYSELALGAKFSYFGQYEDIWIKLSDDDFGLIAEYNPEYIKTNNWVSQKVCSFAETEKDLKNLQVLLRE